jgi:dihydrofolate reductase
MGAHVTSGHVFIAASLDGYIARPDGGLDWLLSYDDGGDDRGYAAFIAGVDVIVMGRGTFETVLSFDPWPYDLPVLVLSSTMGGSDVPDRLQGRVAVANLTPAGAMAHLAQAGHKRAYVDGGRLVQAFLAAGLIEDMIVTRAPVLLGTGRPLFGGLPQDVPLTHLGTKAYPSGLVQSHYLVTTG